MEGIVNTVCFYLPGLAARYLPARWVTEWVSEWAPHLNLKTGASLGDKFRQCPALAWNCYVIEVEIVMKLQLQLLWNWNCYARTVITCVPASAYSNFLFRLSKVSQLAWNLFRTIICLKLSLYVSDPAKRLVWSMRYLGPFFCPSHKHCTVMRLKLWLWLMKRPT